MTKLASFARVMLPCVAVLVAALFFLPESLLAQTGVINAENAMTQLTTQLRPIFRVARYILLIACVGLALMNAFQASRGKGDKWVSVIVLVLVATFMMMPAAALQMFGFDALSQVAEDLFGSDGDF